MLAPETTGLGPSDSAFGCVQDVIDRRHVPVITDMAGLACCYARGLGKLVRMSNYVGKPGCPLQPGFPRARTFSRSCGSPA